MLTELVIQSMPIQPIYGQFVGPLSSSDVAPTEIFKDPSPSRSALAVVNPPAATGNLLVSVCSQEVPAKSEVTGGKYALRLGVGGRGEVTAAPECRVFVLYESGGGTPYVEELR